MADDVARRYQAGPFWSAEEFKADFIIVAAFHEFNVMERGHGGRVDANKPFLFETFEDALTYIRIWQPGYSADGMRAVIWFTFGPAPHGAWGTAAYELRNGQWQNRWFDTAYGA